MATEGVGILGEALMEDLASLVASEVEHELELAKLMETLTAVKRILVDWEQYEGNLMQRLWLEGLKDCLYDMDDLLDEMVTLSLFKRQGENKVGIRSFVMFALKKLAPIWYDSCEMKSIGARLGVIREKIDLLVPRLAKLGPSESNLGVKKKKKKRGYGVSLSFFSPLLPDLVIGRDADKEALIKTLLLDDGDKLNHVSFVSVVGMGGIGKTTLAQLAYHDQRICNHFLLRTWACVSDDFDVRAIARQLLASALGQSRKYPYVAMDWVQLQMQLCETLKGKRYLLVLDDVWNEDRCAWLRLKNLLSVGARGSRILVTTRSRRVAEAIENGPVYDLRGLLEEDSWRLFERVAFEPGQVSTDDSLSEIGKEILRKCCNLPFAITIVGRLLLGQSTSTWLAFKINSLATMRKCEKKLMPIFKISYLHLDPRLKRCFAHCALFPKGYAIEKETLISLWMAQGFIVHDDAKSIEDAAEDYFITLLRSCFFQDVILDDFGEIVSIKIHDLIHDLAQKVATEELLIASSFTTKVSQQTRHLAVVDFENESSILDTLLRECKGIRTFLNFRYPRAAYQFCIDLVSLFRFRCLRALDLRRLNIINLPNTIGRLIHLRYLDLSSNFKLEMLSSSISELLNLQTLILRDCWRLNHLPNLGNLVKLRHLDLYGCNSLTHMPSDVHKLTSLRRLSMFVVGDQSWGSSSKQLESLKTLSNLKGSLTIRILKCLLRYETKAREAGYLRTKEHLKDICIQWNDSKAFNQEYADHEVALLEGLEPHMNCRSLKLKGYSGVRFPSWTMQKLVIIRLEDCTWLRHLPPLGQLFCLRALLLERLVNLEYVENDSSGHVASASNSGAVASVTVFPSLEMLTLCSLPKLLGWRRGIGKGQGSEAGHQLPSFPRLSVLKIHECPFLTSIPPCPNVQELDLRTFHEALPSVLFCNHPWQLQPYTLRSVTIDMVRYLNSLPVESLQNLSCVLVHLSDVESLSASNEVFHSHLPSLEFLQISLCSKLKSLSGLGWMHLTALKRLNLSNLPVLNLAITTAVDDTEEDIMPWKCLSNLRSLELDYLPKLVNLPFGIQYLTSLQTLEIRSCHSLKELPESMKTLINLQFLCIEACTGLERLPQSMCYLTSLCKLEILRCSGCLRERCQQLIGVDWHKIQHIPRIYIN